MWIRTGIDPWQSLLLSLTIYNTYACIKYIPNQLYIPSNRQARIYHSLFTNQELSKNTEKHVLLHRNVPVFTSNKTFLNFVKYEINSENSSIKNVRHNTYSTTNMQGVLRRKRQAPAFVESNSGTEDVFANSVSKNSGDAIAMAGNHNENGSAVARSYAKGSGVSKARAHTTNNGDAKSMSKARESNSSAASLAAGSGNAFSASQAEGKGHAVASSLTLGNGSSQAEAISEDGTAFATAVRRGEHIIESDPSNTTSRKAGRRQDIFDDPFFEEDPRAKPQKTKNEFNDEFFNQNSTTHKNQTHNETSVVTSHEETPNTENEASPKPFKIGGRTMGGAPPETEEEESATEIISTTELSNKFNLLKLRNKKILPDHKDFVFIGLEDEESTVPPEPFKIGGRTMGEDPPEIEEESTTEKGLSSTTKPAESKDSRRKMFAFTVGGGNFETGVSSTTTEKDLASTTISEQSKSTTEITAEDKPFKIGGRTMGGDPPEIEEESTTEQGPSSTTKPAESKDSRRKMFAYTAGGDNFEVGVSSTTTEKDLVSTTISEQSKSTTEITAEDKPFKIGGRTMGGDPPEIEEESTTEKGLSSTTKPAESKDSRRKMFAFTVGGGKFETGVSSTTTEKDLASTTISEQSKSTTEITPEDKPFKIGGRTMGGDPPEIEEESTTEVPMPIATTENPKLTGPNGVAVASARTQKDGNAIAQAGNPNGGGNALARASAMGTGVSNATAKVKDSGNATALAKSKENNSTSSAISGDDGTALAESLSEGSGHSVASSHSFGNGSSQAEATVDEGTALATAVFGGPQKIHEGPFDDDVFSAVELKTERIESTTLTDEKFTEEIISTVTAETAKSSEPENLPPNGNAVVSSVGHNTANAISYANNTTEGGSALARSNAIGSGFSNATAETGEGGNSTAVSKAHENNASAQANTGTDGVAFSKSLTEEAGNADASSNSKGNGTSMAEAAANEGNAVADAVIDEDKDVSKKDNLFSEDLSTSEAPETQRPFKMGGRTMGGEPPEIELEEDSTTESISTTEYVSTVKPKFSLNFEDSYLPSEEPFKVLIGLEEVEPKLTTTSENPETQQPFKMGGRTMGGGPPEIESEEESTTEGLSTVKSKFSLHSIEESNLPSEKPIPIIIALDEETTTTIKPTTEIPTTSEAPESQQPFKMGGRTMGGEPPKVEPEEETTTEVITTTEYISTVKPRYNLHSIEEGYFPSEKKNQVSITLDEEEPIIATTSESPKSPIPFKMGGRTMGGEPPKIEDESITEFIAAAKPMFSMHSIEENYLQSEKPVPVIITIDEEETTTTIKPTTEILSTSEITETQRPFKMGGRTMGGAPPEIEEESTTKLISTTEYISTEKPNLSLQSFNEKYLSSEKPVQVLTPLEEEKPDMTTYENSETQKPFKMGGRTMGGGPPEIESEDKSTTELSNKFHLLKLKKPLKSEQKDLVFIGLEDEEPTKPKVDSTTEKGLSFTTKPAESRDSRRKMFAFTVGDDNGEPKVGSTTEKGPSSTTKPAESKDSRRKMFAFTVGADNLEVGVSSTTTEKDLVSTTISVQSKSSTEITSEDKPFKIGGRTMGGEPPEIDEESTTPIPTATTELRQDGLNGIARASSLTRKSGNAISYANNPNDGGRALSRSSALGTGVSNATAEASDYGNATALAKAHVKNSTAHAISGVDGVSISRSLSEGNGDAVAVSQTKNNGTSMAEATADEGDAVARAHVQSFIDMVKKKVAQQSNAETFEKETTTEIVEISTQNIPTSVIASSAEQLKTRQDLPPNGIAISSALGRNGSNAISHANNSNAGGISVARSSSLGTGFSNSTAETGDGGNSTALAKAHESNSTANTITGTDGVAVSKSISEGSGDVAASSRSKGNGTSTAEATANEGNAVAAATFTGEVRQKTQAETFKSDPFFGGPQTSESTIVFRTTEYPKSKQELSPNGNAVATSLGHKNANAISHANNTNDGGIALARSNAIGTGISNATAETGAGGNSTAVSKAHANNSTANATTGTDGVAISKSFSEGSGDSVAASRSKGNGTSMAEASADEGDAIATAIFDVDDNSHAEAFENDPFFNDDIFKMDTHSPSKTESPEQDKQFKMGGRTLDGAPPEADYYDEETTATWVPTTTEVFAVSPEQVKPNTFIELQSTSTTELPADDKPFKMGGRTMGGAPPDISDESTAFPITTAASKDSRRKMLAFSVGDDNIEPKKSFTTEKYRSSTTISVLSKSTTELPSDDKPFKMGGRTMGGAPPDISDESTAFPITTAASKDSRRKMLAFSVGDDNIERKVGSTTEMDRSSTITPAASKDSRRKMLAFSVGDDNIEPKKSFTTEKYRSSTTISVQSKSTTELPSDDKPFKMGGRTMGGAPPDISDESTAFPITTAASKDSRRKMLAYSVGDDNIEPKISSTNENDLSFTTKPTESKDSRRKMFAFTVGNDNLEPRVDSTTTEKDLGSPTLSLQSKSTTEINAEDKQFKIGGRTMGGEPPEMEEESTTEFFSDSKLVATAKPIDKFSLHTIDANNLDEQKPSQVFIELKETGDTTTMMPTTEIPSKSEVLDKSLPIKMGGRTMGGASPEVEDELTTETIFTTEFISTARPDSKFSMHVIDTKTLDKENPSQIFVELEEAESATTTIKIPTFEASVLSQPFKMGGRTMGGEPPEIEEDSTTEMVSTTTQVISTAQLNNKFSRNSMDDYDKDQSYQVRKALEEAESTTKMSTTNEILSTSEEPAQQQPFKMGGRTMGVGPPEIEDESTTETSNQINIQTATKPVIGKLSLEQTNNSQAYVSLEEDVPTTPENLLSVIGQMGDANTNKSQAFMSLEEEVPTTEYSRVFNLLKLKKKEQPESNLVLISLDDETTISIAKESQIKTSTELPVLENTPFKMGGRTLDGAPPEIEDESTTQSISNTKSISTPKLKFSLHLGDDSIEKSEKSNKILIEIDDARPSLSTTPTNEIPSASDEPAQSQPFKMGGRTMGGEPPEISEESTAIPITTLPPRKLMAFSVDDDNFKTEVISTTEKAGNVITKPATSIASRRKMLAFSVGDDTLGPAGVLSTTEKYRSSTTETVGSSTTETMGISSTKRDSIFITTPAISKDSRRKMFAFSVGDDNMKRGISSTTEKEHSSTTETIESSLTGKGSIFSTTPAATKDSRRKMLAFSVGDDNLEHGVRSTTEIGLSSTTTPSASKNYGLPSKSTTELPAEDKPFKIGGRTMGGAPPAISEETTAIPTTKPVATIGSRRKMAFSVGDDNLEPAVRSTTEKVHSSTTELVDKFNIIKLKNHKFQELQHGQIVIGLQDDQEEEADYKESLTNSSESQEDQTPPKPQGRTMGAPEPDISTEHTSEGSTRSTTPLPLHHGDRHVHKMEKYFIFLHRHMLSALGTKRPSSSEREESAIISSIFDDKSEETAKYAISAERVDPKDEESAEPILSKLEDSAERDE